METSGENTGRRIRVLVVDDSAFARLTITKHLASDQCIEIVGTACDGLDALEKLRQLNPDVITLDIEMPKMNGLETLEKIMAQKPTPVVMLSSLTAPNATATMKALENGAVDFFLKPSLLNPVGAGTTLVSELIQKVKIAASTRISLLSARPVSEAPRLEKYNGQHARLRNGSFSKVVIIGSSTGGPRALYEIVPKLPANIDAALLIVQHMPPNFTRSLSERLNPLSQIEVKEANDGDGIIGGQALVAPGGMNMAVRANAVRLEMSPPTCGVRPSVDITMGTAAEVFGKRCVGVVLTGMGADGTQGAAKIKMAGGTVLAEDKSTCVVYGMPKSVADAGYADSVIPLQHMAKAITSICGTL